MSDLVSFDELPTELQGNITLPPPEYVDEGVEKDEALAALRAAKLSAELHRGGFTADTTIERSENLSLKDFQSVVAPQDLRGHFVVHFSNYNLPPLMASRGSYVRLLHACGTKKSARRFVRKHKSKLAPEMGTMRYMRGCTWTPIMRSPQEQDDSDLVRAHLKVQLARAEWCTQVRLAILQRKSQGKLRGVDYSKLMVHLVRPPALPTPVGRILSDAEFQEQLCSTQHTINKPPTPGSLASSEEDDDSSGSDDEDEEEKKDGLYKDGIHTMPSFCNVDRSNSGYVIMSVFPDMTLNEHLWLPALQKQVVELLGEGTVPPCPGRRVFDDDIPRPIIRFYPMFITDRTSASTASEYTQTLQTLVQDVYCHDLEIGRWCNPQHLDTSKSKRIYRTDAENELFNTNMETRRRATALFRQRCEAAGVEPMVINMSAAATCMDSGPADTLDADLAALRAQYDS